MSPPSRLVIIVTGSDSGFGLMTAEALAQAGHTVYAGLLQARDNAPTRYEAFETFARRHQRDIRGIHLNVVQDDVIQQSVAQILQEQHRIDAIIHNAGHMCLGPAEAFSPSQFFAMYDTNCVGCHRLNRAILPHMRARRSGLLIWVSSGSAHGPSSPYLAAYFAAKAAQDSLAQTTALEVSQWGVESSIVTPGIFTSGTNHFGSAMRADDPDVERQYNAEEAPTKGWFERCLKGSAEMGDPRLDIKPQAVADAIVEIVGTEHGRRPWRVHVEPEGPMAERTNRVRDRVRAEYLERMGCAELMKVKLFGVE
ncbi:uncharacterized protein HMPREF1541_10721 [Cyphellophora europaea CBS 101466]|uniref:Cytochrome c domain-containing protein n=1 Tax=Cyphellophora europaea (strain CBS 101466) TaxID=1220924 RepID=W2S631_CYPE1|nr:uncharacterized protein HMPREF1541_10721 [Cyphellophora europaea CBS 101466]ETN44171.1 hypothetical protein HMPREF1541_10721 [Cyphellophora europaea CBS 101466]